MLKVVFADWQNFVKPDRLMLRRLCRAAAPPEWSNAELSVTFVGDAHIEEMNKKFLGKDGPTDVLAFPLEGADGGERPVIGEVVVSAERACREAAERGLEPREELALYVVHGVLHLAGHDDGGRGQRGRMQARERAILAAAGLRRDAEPA